MIVFLNGQFVPEQQAMVSVFDRSFLYGDGLFETMLVVNGVPFRWNQHMTRFQRGAAFLGIRVPYEILALREIASSLIEQNAMPFALLRLSLSRGVGVRGYSPRGADAPGVVMSLHPAPAMTPQPINWKVATSRFRLPANEPLAQLKHCNKLPQILARAQAELAGADEALLVNTDGFIVEGASSNLFWVNQGSVYTPALATGVLSGITRSVVFELCDRLSIGIGEASITPESLPEADGVFLSLSSYGIVQAVFLDGQRLNQSSLVQTLQAHYSQIVQEETASQTTTSIRETGVN